MSSYIYQHGNEPVRQSHQAKIMHEQSLHLLWEAGLRPGMSVLDFGCGTANLDFSIASMLGPGGKVLGVDCNPGLISLNRKRKQTVEDGNLFFRIGRAENYTDIFQYDITFARFLVAHTAMPLKLVRNMQGLTRNYGYIALEDVDISTMRAVPHNPELEVLKTLIKALVHYYGGDATIGSQLGPLLHASGLRRVRAFSHQPAGAAGPIKQVPLFVLESIQLTLLQLGLATPEQLLRLSEGLKKLAEDNHTVFYFPRIYQVIGYNNHTLKLNLPKLSVALQPGM